VGRLDGQRIQIYRYVCNFCRDDDTVEADSDSHNAEVAAVLSAGTMFICYMLVVVGKSLAKLADFEVNLRTILSGHGVQGTPNGYKPATATTPATSLEWTVWAPEGTTFVQGVSALLNIA
jgi:hypothetical protein